MNAGLKIAFCFVVGIGCGAFSVMPECFSNEDISQYALWVLLFLVGIGMGGNPQTWQILRQMNAKILLVPVCVIIGTLAGTAVFSSCLQNISLRESLAVVSGFGYYSLSSIMITQIRGETLGVIALLSNIMREISTLLMTPLLIRYFGRLAPIASGGATSMDTTLPIIIRFAGQEYGIISLFSGIVLTLTVPILIRLIL